jgi:hypothetical protein
VLLDNYFFIKVFHDVSCKEIAHFVAEHLVLHVDANGIKVENSPSPSRSFQPHVLTSGCFLPKIGGT